MLAGRQPELRSDRPTPGFIVPLQPTLVPEPPEGDEWQHEIKHDGYRTELIVTQDRRRAFTRNGHDWSQQYRPILDAAADLTCASAILDGEMIVQDREGRSDFDGLRRAIARRSDALIFYGFDLLWLNGRDLRKRPLSERRSMLEELIGGHDPEWPLQFSSHVVGGGGAFFDLVQGMGLEGIVSKRRSSRYVSGRSTSWLKCKAFEEGEFVVVGHERSVGPTTALLARDTPDGLEYVGGAMVTLSSGQRDHFWSEMERLAADRPPIPTTKRKASWVRPELRVRARYLKGEGKLRHATLTGIISAA